MEKKLIPVNTGIALIFPVKVLRLITDNFIQVVGKEPKNIGFILSYENGKIKKTKIKNMVYKMNPVDRDIIVFNEGSTDSYEYDIKNPNASSIRKLYFKKDYSPFNFWTKKHDGVVSRSKPEVFKSRNIGTQDVMMRGGDMKEIILNSAQYDNNNKKFHYQFIVKYEINNGINNGIEINSITFNKSYDEYTEEEEVDSTQEGGVFGWFKKRFGFKNKAGITPAPVAPPPALPPIKSSRGPLPPPPAAQAPQGPPQAQAPPPPLPRRPAPQDIYATVNKSRRPPPPLPPRSVSTSSSSSSSSTSSSLPLPPLIEFEIDSKNDHILLRQFLSTPIMNNFSNYFSRIITRREISIETPIINGIIQYYTSTSTPTTTKPIFDNPYLLTNTGIQIVQQTSDLTKGLYGKINNRNKYSDAGVLTSDQNFDHYVIYIDDNPEGSNYKNTNLSSRQHPMLLKSDDKVRVIGLKSNDFNGITSNYKAVLDMIRGQIQQIVGTHYQQGHLKQLKITIKLDFDCTLAGAHMYVCTIGPLGDSADTMKHRNMFVNYVQNNYPDIFNNAKNNQQIKCFAIDSVGNKIINVNALHEYLLMNMVKVQEMLYNYFINTTFINNNHTLDRGVLLMKMLNAIKRMPGFEYDKLYHPDRSDHEYHEYTQGISRSGSMSSSTDSPVAKAVPIHASLGEVFRNNQEQYSLFADPRVKAPLSAVDSSISPLRRQKAFKKRPIQSRTAPTDEQRVALAEMQRFTQAGGSRNVQYFRLKYFENESEV